MLDWTIHFILFTLLEINQAHFIYIPHAYEFSFTEIKFNNWISPYKYYLQSTASAYSHKNYGFSLSVSYNKCV